MNKKKRKRYILAAVCAAGLLAVIYFKMTPGPIRYYGLPEAVWTNDYHAEVTIEGVEYEFYGPWEHGMKRGRLVAYVLRDDGYYTEYYEVKGEEDLLISIRRVIMGDQYVVQVRKPG